VIPAHDGRWAKAEEAFRTGRRLAPRNIDAAIGLAGAMAALGRTEEALASLGEARELARGSDELVDAIDRRIELVRAASSQADGRRQE